MYPVLVSPSLVWCPRTITKWQFRVLIQSALCTRAVMELALDSAILSLFPAFDQSWCIAGLYHEQLDPGDRNISSPPPPSPNFIHQKFLILHAPAWLSLVVSLSLSQHWAAAFGLPSRLRVCACVYVWHVVYELASLANSVTFPSPPVFNYLASYCMCTVCSLWWTRRLCPAMGHTIATLSYLS